MSMLLIGGMGGRKKSMMAGLILIIFTIVLAIYIVLFTRIDKRQRRFRVKQFDNSSNYIKYKYDKYIEPVNQRCQIRELNPYHADVLPYLSKRNLPPCTMKRYGTLHNGILYLKVKDLQEAWLYYIRRKGDFDFKWSQAFRVDNITKRGFHGSECWNYCNNTTGPCPLYCGVGGYCCRTGFVGCPENAIGISSSNHACAYLHKSTKAPPNKEVEIQYPVEEDFFKLSLKINNGYHQEFHAALAKQNKPTSTNQPTNPSTNQPTNGSNRESIQQNKSNASFNILMIMLDAVSNANFQRSLKTSYKYLKDDPNTFIFKGQSVVGDGTTAQLTAAFTGIPMDDQPEARTGVKGAQNVDRWPFIFKDMHKLGYKTLYSEDTYVGATFNYRHIGWKNAPTTKYTRPWWMAMEPILKKNSPVCGLDLSFEYLKRFTTAYAGDKKFSFTLLSRVSHDDMNSLPAIDTGILDFHKYLKDSGQLKNTVVFTFGDHGYRAGWFRSTLHGRLEERLPFLAVTLPPSFKVQSEYIKNIEDNTNLMTSPFDMYATLQHILSWPNYDRKKKGIFGESLFSDIKSLNRTCADAGVTKHWCACLDFEVVDVQKDPTVLKVVTKVIKYINTLNEAVAKGNCSTLALLQVIRAGRRVRNFYKETNEMRYTYEIAFSVSPSAAEYEVTRECVFKKGVLTVNENNVISRTNFYRHQPDCVAKQHPNLRKFCYCKNYKEPTMKTSTTNYTHSGKNYKEPTMKLSTTNYTHSGKNYKEPTMKMSTTNYTHSGKIS